MTANFWPLQKECSAPGLSSRIYLSSLITCNNWVVVSISQEHAQLTRKQRHRINLDTDGICPNVVAYYWSVYMYMYLCTSRQILEWPFRRTVRRNW